MRPFLVIFAAMVSIVRVYNIVRDIANKDQKGFIAPNVFNSFARAAQQNIFNEMFNEMKLATALRRSGRDAGRDKSAYKMVEEDLSTYIMNLIVGDLEELQTNDDGVNPDGAFVFRRPGDFARIISMTVTDTNTSVELVSDSEKINRILNSNLSAPTDAFPVALEMNEVFEIFPDSIDSVTLRYYRQPAARAETEVSVFDGVVGGEVQTITYGQGEYIPASQPTFVADSVDDGTGFVIHNLTQSRGFDLPAHYLNEVVMEILQLIGVRLRDPLLQQYGLLETQAE